MISRRFRNGGILEIGLATIVVLGWLVVLSQFLHNGYLPPPFPVDTLDEFMDWYNPAYWSYHRGTYYVEGLGGFQSVYPPITYIVIRIFSIPSCYSTDPFVGRDCDKVGIIFLSTTFVINIFLTLRAFRGLGLPRMISRGLALSLSLPMVFALDRGNIIILTYTFFVLGFGGLLRGSWAKSICIAMVISLKIYLITILAAPFLKRKWWSLERMVVSGMLVYLVTWAIYGSGGPVELVGNLSIYQNQYVNAGSPLFSSLSFAGSYLPLYKYATFDFPLTQFIGSRWIELVSIVPLVLIKGGQLCVGVTFLCALTRPKAIPTSRLIAQAVGFVLITTEIGGYSEVFMIFALFLERRRGVAIWVSLIAGYGLCFPVDHIAYLITHDIRSDYLSGKVVGYDLGISYGMFLRPGLNLIIQYALACASLRDLAGSLRGERARSPLPRLPQTQSP